VTPAPLAPPFLLAAALLAAAGAVKVLRPRPTAQALLDAGLPASDGAARGLGLIEVATGGWALLSGSPASALALGAVYLAFAGFLAYVLHAHPDADSCGCAGAKAVPPSRLHLALNLLAAAVGIAYALAGGGSGIGWLTELGIWSIVAAGGLVVAGWLAVVLVTEVPDAWQAWRPAAAHEHHHGADRHTAAEDALTSAGIGAGHASLWPGTEPSAGDNR
jgi:hypothetical protein